jgi:two-component system sensor histidine kinase HydH
MSAAPEDPRLAQWGALAAGLAHEVNNPLSTMSIGLDLLREDLQGRPHVSSAHLLPRIDLLLREVGHLQRIVQDFLRLAREPQLDLRERDPHRLLEEVLALLGPELELARIAVTTQLDRTVTLLRLDPDLFRQVLMNVFRNAIQAMPEGGTLTVLTRGTPDDFSFEIIDTGRGIPPELLGRIFDGFFSTRPGGTGIGLTIARQIVDQHKGRISCESAPGRGTRFLITLPREKAASP